MSLLVPFDNSPLSRAALLRAAQFDAILDEGVIAVSVIPNGNARYAREQGWLDTSDEYDVESIISELRAAVAEIAPSATFQHELVDRRAPMGTIASRLRRLANEHEASIVFLGSENAGRIVSGFTVGSAIASDRGYDTMIINSVRPTPVEKLESAGPSIERLEGAS